MDRELRDYLDARFAAVDEKIDAAKAAIFQRMDEMAAALPSCNSVRLRWKTASWKSRSG